MKVKLLLIPLALIALGGIVIAQSASAQGPGPSAGEVVSDGLILPRGIAVASDGSVYVAEAGTGGNIPLETPDGTLMTGLTGRISKIDPDTGERTTVVDGLPSVDLGDGDAVGPADVAFIGTNLYYVQTAAGEPFGFPETPTGIYRVASNGDTTLVADIGTFNTDNPPPRVVSGEQEDVLPGGNPYSMLVRGGVFFVADANFNQILRVTTGGAITRFLDFNQNNVPTGIMSPADGGPLYVTTLGPGPFLPQDGKLLSVAANGSSFNEVASGASMLTAVDAAPDGTVYVLQFNDTTAAGEEVFAPFTGKVLKLNDDGTFSAMVTGLTFASSMEFDGDTLYVANDGLNALGTGSLLMIENFSSVEPPPAPTAQPTSVATQPPAPAATATPRGGVIGAPDTGDGPASADGSANALLPLFVLGITGAALALAGARIVAKRD